MMGTFYQPDGSITTSAANPPAARPTPQGSSEVGGLLEFADTLLDAAANAGVDPDADECDLLPLTLTGRECADFGNAIHRLAALNSEATTTAAARPLEDWSEGIGDVVWWAFPVEEAAWIGSPLNSDWPGYHTHWTPHPPVPAHLNASKGGDE